MDEENKIDQVKAEVESAPVTAPVEAEPKKEVKKVRAPRGKKIKKQVFHGRVYIKATYNNTIVSLTDQNGNLLAWSSAGQVGFRGPKKATPYAAGVIVRNVAEKVKDYGLKDVNVFVKGVGSGREAAVRALNANGLNILSIQDLTPIPHGGCRPPRPRRV